MKKFILPLILLTIGFSSCGDDDDKNEIKVGIKDILMHFDGEVQIGATSPTEITYRSLNDFHAMVDKYGTMKGRWIGETEIILTNSYDEKRIKVTVAPRVKLYDEPALKFGSSRKEMIQLLGKPFSETEDAILYLNTENNILVGYFFANDKLLLAMAAVNTNIHHLTLEEYLNERYRSAGYTEDKSTLYINALHPKDATTIVEVSLSEDGTRYIGYMDATNIEWTRSNTEANAAMKQAIQKIKIAE